MKAIGFYKGQPIEDPQSLMDFEMDAPEATGHDLLVQIKAVSVNPVDTKLRQTLPATEEPHILGYDGVGVVVGTGEAVENFDTGDRVYFAGTTTREGANQEYALVDERIVGRAPKALDDNEAAAMPLTSITAYELLFEKMGLKAAANANQGESILVINGAGGVGSILTQLAQWSGLDVYATSSPKKFDWLTQNGVAHPLDYHENIKDQLVAMGQTSFRYIVILFDPAPYFALAADLLSPFGHIGSIVETKESLPMGRIKNLAGSFDWEYMFAKTDASYHLESQGLMLNQVAQLLDAGALHATMTSAITTGINAANLKDAHQMVEQGTMTGKVVVSGPFNA